MDVEWWNLEKFFKFFYKFWKFKQRKPSSRRGDESLSREGQHFDCCGWSAIGARSCQHLKAYKTDATNGFRQTISQVYADLWKIYGDAHTCSVVSELEGAGRFAWEREPSFVSLVWVFMEKLKTSLGYVAMEFPFLWTIWWEDHHFAFSIPLERISTKDISPENFKGASDDITRDYFGPTRKIYVYSGTSKWIFHSHGPHAHLGQPTSKGSCMRKPVNRIP